MKKILQITSFTLFIFLVATGISLAQDAVTLTVTGQGATQEEARDNALRSAIEQAFGVFISSNTEIVNDELTRDEIVSVSSGNIQDYEVLYENKINKDYYANTLKAVVSINNLKSYAESNGVEVEVKGGLFAANMRQQELNEKNELQSVKNMMVVLNELLSRSFDAELEIGNPVKGSGDKWKLPLEIIITDNDNYDQAFDYLRKTMSGLSMNLEELTSYSEAGKDIYPLQVQNSINYFRNAKSIDYLMHQYSEVLFNSIFDFTIDSNDELLAIEMPYFSFEELRDPSKYSQEYRSGIVPDVPEMYEIFVKINDSKYLLSQETLNQSSFSPVRTSSNSADNFFWNFKWLNTEDDLNDSSLGVGIRGFKRFDGNLRMGISGEGYTASLLVERFGQKHLAFEEYIDDLTREIEIDSLDENGLELLRYYHENIIFNEKENDQSGGIVSTRDGFYPHIYKYTYPESYSIGRQFSHQVGYRMVYELDNIAVISISPELELKTIEQITKLEIVDK